MKLIIYCVFFIVTCSMTSVLAEELQIPVPDDARACTVTFSYYNHDDDDAKGYVRFSCKDRDAISINKGKLVQVSNVTDALLRYHFGPPTCVVSGSPSIRSVLTCIFTRTQLPSSPGSESIAGASSSSSERVSRVN